MIAQGGPHWDVEKVALVANDVVKEASEEGGDSELRWASAEDMVLMQMRFWALRHSDAVFLVEEISRMNFTAAVPAGASWQMSSLIFRRVGK